MHLDPDKPFVIQFETSDVAVAAILLQKNTEGNVQPCTYTSKKLMETQQRWAVWEKEAYVVRWALLTWRHFLEGNAIPFKLWTGRKNLEALKTPLGRASSPQSRSIGCNTLNNSLF